MRSEASVLCFGLWPVKACNVSGGSSRGEAVNRPLPYLYTLYFVGCRASVLCAQVGTSGVY